MSDKITDMDVFFNPKSIAIIGASETFKFGYTMTNYLLNSNFKTYPVNINKDIIFGHKVFKNINEIPDDIELAIIVVKNENVLQVVKDSVKKEVKGIIIETAGFAETSIEKLVNIQKEIEIIAKNSNVRIIGPNCVGITNFDNKFTTAEIDFNQSIEGGTISVIAQSGVLGNIFVEWSASQNIGFSKTITLGNKVDVDEIDMLEYLENDPNTNVITVYLEGVKRGPKLVEILKKLTKPVLILKNGRSEIGSKAIKSHTGSIAGNDKIYDAIFKQYSGIYRVNNFYEMFNIAQVFATQPLPKGKNIAIITSSGSLGILACDEIERLGLKLAVLNDSSIQEMKSISPNWTSLKNPVDLGPSLFMTFSQSLKAILNDEGVDALLHIFAVPQRPIKEFSLPITPHLKDLRNLSTKLKKPVITCVFGSRWVVEYFLKHSYKYKIPIMAQISHAIKALKFMYDFGQSNKNINKNIEI
ncbi:MAG: CoA-binding protein [Candidatus Lokiarchaeota archaeon]|nr:CoA-binding protein [Candidatus Lokiarchaeota archaeon]